MNIATTNGKKYRPTIEGFKIARARAMAKMGQIPEEIEQILTEIGLTTAKRIGLIPFKEILE